MMKICNHYLLLLLFVFLFSSCKMMEQKQPETNTPKSSLNVLQFTKELKKNIQLSKAIAIAGINPEQLKGGIVYFKMNDGDVWCKVEKQAGKLKQITFWASRTLLKNGREIRDSSENQPVNTPVCIAVEFVSDFKDIHKEGKLYYEDYGSGNVFIKVLNNDEPPKSKIDIIFSKRKYVVIRGEVPNKSEFKYFMSYLANLALLQKLIAIGTKNSTPLRNSQRKFMVSEDHKPLVIILLGKKIVYPAPWSLFGTITPEQGKKSFVFDLNFEATWGKYQNAVDQITHFTGRFTQKTKSFYKDLDISSWKQFYVDKNKALTPLEKRTFSLGDLQ